MLLTEPSTRSTDCPAAERTGRVHSFETCGTVDGPGIRFVVFLQGCPLRCLYCHNPDTWKSGEGTLMRADEIMREVRKYRSFFRFSGGGVTVTGGEPLMQPAFVSALFELCGAEGIHRTLDTSGFASISKAARALALTDLVMLDIKSMDRAMHKRITGVDLASVLVFARWLSRKGKRIWIRHVVVPGLTDDDRRLSDLADFAGSLESVELVDLLPFQKMAEYKWDYLHYPYQLRETRPPSPERMAEIAGLFASRGLKVR